LSFQGKLLCRLQIADASHVEQGQDARQIAFVHHHDKSFADGNFATVGDFLFPAIRHFDDKWDAFLNRNLYPVFRHQEASLGNSVASFMVSSGMAP
jgi:hypothetical protein